jgi:hypothetical protein
MAAPVLQGYGIGNVDELLTTSLANLMPGIKDNVFKANPVLNWLYAGRNAIKRRGGASVSHGEMYGVNSTALSYQRYDALDTTPQDGLTRDQWSWAQYAVTVTIDGFLERIANAGDWKIEDILDTKKLQAQESLELLLEQHFFQASPGPKDLRSLATIIANSGTEGGINGTTNTWWQAQVKTSGSWAAQGPSDLTNLVNTIAFQNPAGNPELLCSDQTSFEAYQNSLRAFERLTDNKMEDIGIINLKFMGIPWTFSPQGTSGVIYALHSAAIEFIVNTDTDFLLTPFVMPTNQDARTAKILLAACLTTGNRRKLGKATSVAA